MTQRFTVRRGGEARFAVPDWAHGATGFTRWSIVDESVPAVHTGFGICELEPGGAVPAQVQSYEEDFFVLDGEVVLQTPEGARLLRPGDYGLVPVGTPHTWRNESRDVARWADMLAPQPRPAYADDTVAVPPLAETAPEPVDPRDPRTRRFGHIEPVNMDPGKQSQDLLALSASMRTALLVYSGITVKMMVDEDLGAQLTTMFMVQYDADGVAGPHDHPFEETYLFIEGKAEAVFDGERFELGPGDAAFAGVGCVHGFRNLGDGPLRWLETQAPQPPARHSYRFTRDWDYLRSKLGEQP
jgi:mannose-6-phosphate isomerase-like protein (cupin superfamily)